MKKRLSDFLNSNIITMWMTSFICLILISVTAMLISYLSVEVRLIKKVERMNETFMEDRIRLVENYIGNISIGLINISKNCSEDDLLSLPRLSGAERSAALDDVIESLDSVGVGNSESGMKFIYYPGGNYIIGNGIMRSPEDFFRTIGSKGSFEQWSEKVLDESAGNAMCYDSTDDMLYFRLWHGKKYSMMSEVLFVISISKSDFEENFKGIPGFDFVICSIGNEQIISMSGEDYSDILKEVEYSSRVKTKPIGNKIVSSRRGIGTDWNYVCINDNTEYINAFRVSRIILFLTMIVMTIMSVLLSYYFTKRNNSFIFKLSEKLNIKDEKNEYMAIYESVKDIMHQSNAKSTLIHKYEQEYIQKLLQNLITADAGGDMEKELKECGISFDFPYYCIARVEIIKYNDIFYEHNTDQIETLQMSQYIVSNIYGDLYNDGIRIVPVKAGKKIVLIINCSEKIRTNKKDIYKILDFGAAFIEENFNISLRIIISEIKMGLDKIKDLYSGVVRASGWRNMNSSEILDVESIETQKKFDNCFYYPEKDEELLFSYFANGYREKAAEMIHSVFDENIKKKTPSAFFNILVSSIVGSMIKTVNVYDVSNAELYEAINEVYHSLKDFEPVSELERRLCKLSDMVCDYNARENATDKRKVVDEIKRFIEEKYTDNALNVTYVAQWFNMKPSYLSTLFKKQEGIGVLEFVNITRVNGAKKLFDETDMSISEILTKTGFVSERTFFRVFEKYTRTSPGKYRQNGKIQRINDKKND